MVTAAVWVVVSQFTEKNTLTFIYSAPGQRKDDDLMMIYHKAY